MCRPTKKAPRSLEAGPSLPIGLCAKRWLVLSHPLHKAPVRLGTDPGSILSRKIDYVGEPSCA
jgi:hypothetical protein